MKTVTQIARRFNISADTIRHYTRLGLLSPVRDSTNGYRRYRRTDEARLRFLVSAKRVGFSLKDIREIFDMASSGHAACPLVRQLIDQRLTAIREEMRDAQALLKRMERASQSWNQLPDLAPSGESICHLIENWDNGDFIDDDTTSRSGTE